MSDKKCKQKARIKLNIKSYRNNMTKLIKLIKANRYENYFKIINVTKNK